MAEGKSGELRGRKPLRRWARRLGLALLGLLAAAGLALVAAYAWLQTDRGSAWLKGRIEAAITASLAGELTIGSLDPGLISSQATELTLREPDGTEVARLERVRLRLAPLALLRGRVELSRLEVTGLRVRLESGREGLNVSRATAPAEPSAESPDAAPSRPFLPLSLRVRDLRLHDSSFSYAEEGQAPVFTLEQAQAAGSVDVEGNRLRAALELDGRQGAPFSAPLAVTLQVDGRGARWEASAGLVVAEGRLRAKGSFEAGQGAATVEQLHAPPALVRALVPDYPLQVPVDAPGEVVLRDGRLTFSLAPRLGSAAGWLEGLLDLDSGELERLRYVASGLDLGQLLARGPSSSIGLRLEAGGVKIGEAGLDGRFELALEPSRIEGLTTGPSRFEGRLRAGVLELAPSIVRIPGTELQLSGKVGDGTLGIDGTASVADLHRTVSALGPLLVAQPPPVRGRGRLVLRVQGPTSSPALRIEAHFPRLSVAEQRLAGLVVRLRLPDLARPLASEGELRAARMDAGGMALTRLEVELRHRRLALRVRGPSASALRMRGVVEPDGRALVVQGLTLQLPAAAREAGAPDGAAGGGTLGPCWELAHPARFELDSGRLAIRSLEMRSGGQTVALDAWKRAERLGATLSLVRIDLAGLPEGLLAPGLRAGGRLTARLEASGRVELPRLEAHLELEHGVLGEARSRSLTVDGSWDGGRAEGRLRMSELRFRDVRLDGAAVALDARGRETQLRAEAEVGGARSTLQLTVGRTLGQLAREQLLRQTQGKAGLDLQRLAAIPVDLVAKLEALPVALPGAGRASTLPAGKGKVDDAGGPALLTLRADLHGTALAPQGQIEGRLDGLKQGPATSVRAALGFGESEVTVRVDADRHGRHVLELDGGWGAPVSAAFSPARRDRAPLRLTGRIHALPLAGLGFLFAGQGGEELPGELQVPPLRAAASAARGPVSPTPPLAGVLDGSFSLEGSLAAPQLRSQLAVADLYVDGVKVGPMTATASYRDRKAALQVEAGEPPAQERPRPAGPAPALGEGRLSLRASAQADLSAAGLRRLYLSRVPFEATLSANRLDVRPLAHLLPEVRGISGALDGSLAVSGPLVRLAAKGRLELTEGTLALAGYGDYRDLHLLISGDQTRLALEDLSARAGAGEVRLRGEAVRGEGGYALRLEARARELPVVDEDQLQGWFSARVTARGRVAGMEVTLPEVRVAGAEFRLPEFETKEVQPLERPQSIVLMRDGQPIAPSRQAVGGSGEAAGPGDEPYTGLRVAAALSAPDDIRVFGDEGLQAVVRLSPDFRLRLADRTAVFGQVSVRRGEFNALGRNFRVQEGSNARFQGPPERPRIDATAIYEDPRQDLSVFLQVRGEGENLKLTVRSEPPLPESEIYNVLATGRRELQPGEQGAGAGAAGGAAASLAGSFLAGQLEAAFGPVLPFQVLSIQTGETFGTARVQAGRYLSPRLYLGYLARLGQPVRSRENANEFELEYQLTEDWSLQGAYGDANSGEANLVWQNQY